MNAPAEKTVVIEDLRKILAEADRIVVKGSPRPDAWTLLESTEKKDLEELMESLVLKTPTHWFHCMCDGTPAIYVYERGRQRLELTNHHGQSIRCSLWDSDVHISDPEKWLYWFDHRGIPGPRQEFENLRTQEKQAQRDRDKWLAAMPEPIRPVWSGSLGQFGSVNIAPLRASLERDIPDEGQRILVLLEWFGSGAGPWSGFPSYETAAEELLFGFSTASILASVGSAQLSPAQTEGAARFFAGWSFGRRRPEDLKRLPGALKRVLWHRTKDTQDKDKLHRAKRALAE
jgi:hypothetical protein